MVESGSLLTSWALIRSHRFESYTHRHYGVSNRQGVCTAWKADGSRKGIGVGYLLLRQFNGWLSRAASVLASKAKGACKGMVIDTSATRQLCLPSTASPLGHSRLASPLLEEMSGTVLCVLSSEVEHRCYIPSVGGSIPSGRTIILRSPSG